MLPQTIAIDGPAASGKTTLAQVLAERLGYFYLDTGLMYRAITYAALERGIAATDEQAVTRLAESVVINVVPRNAPASRHDEAGSPGSSGATRQEQKSIVTIDGQDVTQNLTQESVERNVSLVSTYAGVRRALTAQQRRIAARGRVILAGRDIGTVVLPDADCKIFLTASLEARAQRRRLERLARGQHVTLEQMRDEIQQRDEMDSRRALAPLLPAADAIWLDNTHLTIEQTVERALEIIHDRARHLVQEQQ